VIQVTEVGLAVFQTRVMKYKLLSFLVVFFVMLWAHAAMQSAPAVKADSKEAGQAQVACPCCGKEMSATSKDMASCCQAMATENGKNKCCRAGQNAENCCMKNETACKRSGKDKNASSSAPGCCSKLSHESCCKMKHDAAAMNCCAKDRCARKSAASAGS
jgi:hypothetical protein